MVATYAKQQEVRQEGIRAQKAAAEAARYVKF